MLLAGAGSGKTTVLIQRVYNLLTYGRGSDSDQVPDWASEEDLRFLENFPARPTEEDARRAWKLCAVDVPRPWEIIAITFTNKAAGELKDRLAARLGPEANEVWGIHLSLRLCADPAAGHRPAGVRQGLHHLRHPMTPSGWSGTS